MDLAANFFNSSLLGPEGFDPLAGLIERSTNHHLSYSAPDYAVAQFPRLEGAAP